VCAGPYAQRLLGIDAPLARLFEEELLRKDELVRPGFSRLRYHQWEEDEAIISTMP
jgi:hypothetical protein